MSAELISRQEMKIIKLAEMIAVPVSVQARMMLLHLIS
jgi:hypothetical protein